MNNRIIVNVSFGDYYKPYKARLDASLDAYAPSETVHSFGMMQPHWMKHEDAPYAFKLEAIKEARALGFQQIIWLDAGAYLVAPLDNLWRRIQEDGYYLVDSNQLLGDWISDTALKHFGYTRAQIWDSQLMLLGGMPYGFDFTNKQVCAFFDEWYACAKAGLFKEQTEKYKDPRVQGHRHDESIAAILANKHDMDPSPFGDLYCSQYPEMKGCCIASGYSL